VRALLLYSLKSPAGMGWGEKEQAPSEARTALAPPAAYDSEQNYRTITATWQCGWFS
jgi:hypothetical protein